MTNILVTGADGQLGRELQDLVKNPESKMYHPEFHYYFTDHDELDITDSASIESYCEENRIDTLVNCAAFTAVDKAESEQKLADLTNHLAVKNMAIIAKDHRIKLIHISTDYVFYGSYYKPFGEEDETNPQSVYGKTKLAGEKAILQVAPPNSIVIRSSWVYSSYGNNFVKTMLRLGKEKQELNVVDDQIGSPTYARDLAEAILHIVQHTPNDVEHPPRVFHYSNEGFCSWYDFAKEIMRIAGLDCRINPLKTHQYPTPAKRPRYSMLSKEKIKKDFNIEIPNWENSLDECLVKMDVKRL